MNLKINKLLLSILPVTLLGLIILILSFTRQTNKDVQQKPIKFGYLPITGSIALFVANEQGLFTKNGVTVDPIPFESSNPLAEALFAGKIDAEIGTSTVVMSTLVGKIPDKVTVVLMNSYDGKPYSITSIIARKDSDITSVSDLKGKKIACFPGITNKTLTRIFLQKNRTYDKNTQIIEMAANLQLQSLDNGSVDAVSIYEPYGTLGVVSGKAKVIVQSPIETEVLNPWIAGTASVNNDFLKNRPREANALIQSLNEAVDYIRTNPAQSKQTLIKYSPVKDQPVIDQLPLPNVLKSGEINESDFQSMIDLFYNEKLLDKKVLLKDLLLN